MFSRIPNLVNKIHKRGRDYEKTISIEYLSRLKKELMNHEFQLNMQIKQMETEILKERESQKEDRKDERTKIQATQQSELIDQRKKESPPKNFESSGNDIMGGGFGLNAFDPR